MPDTPSPYENREIKELNDEDPSTDITDYSSFDMNDEKCLSKYALKSVSNKGFDNEEDTEKYIDNFESGNEIGEVGGETEEFGFDNQEMGGDNEIENQELGLENQEIGGDNDESEIDNQELDIETEKSFDGDNEEFDSGSNKSDGDAKEGRGNMIIITG